MLVEIADVGREKAVQAKGVTLLVGKGRAFVPAGSVNEFETREEDWLFLHRVLLCVAVETFAQAELLRGYIAKVKRETAAHRWIPGDGTAYPGHTKPSGLLP